MVVGGLSQDNTLLSTAGKPFVASIEHGGRPVFVTEFGLSGSVRAVDYDNSKGTIGALTDTFPVYYLVIKGDGSLSKAI